MNREIRELRNLHIKDFGLRPSEVGSALHGARIERFRKYLRDYDLKTDN
jgi:hypothetical protein